jgi:hypothetical protein
MRRLIGVSGRRLCPLDKACVELWMSISEGRETAAEMALATDVGVDAHPLRMDT